MLEQFFSVSSRLVKYKLGWNSNKNGENEMKSLLVQGPHFKPMTSKEGKKLKMDLFGRVSSRTNKYNWIYFCDGDGD